MTIQVVTIIEEVRPGFTRSRVVSVDDRIIVDHYEPDSPVVWYCDHCGTGQPVTAQFLTKRQGAVTLCAVCLQNALNGIAYSRANPTERA